MKPQDENKTNDLSAPPGTEVHEYDGIQEHDHALPRWWVTLFYVSILFSVFYYAHYTFGPGATLREEYATEMRDLEAVQSAPSGPSRGAQDEDGLRAWAGVADHVTQGKTAFQAKCAVCHGSEGQGGIGPNLTDDFWIHGAKRTEIAQVITQGVGDKGMPPWGALVSADELRSLVAYVRSLHGTHPPQPKAPQGEKVVMEQ
ncbi:MAG: hypothetical protein RJB38_474 [Pseudomonadota bacterium]|jgi:cytochrome c oxidase cbb3-type subunit 3